MISDHDLIKLALLEDVGTGDITSSALLKNARLQPAGAIIAARSAGIVSGEELVKMVFDEIVGEEVIRFVVKDGHEVVPGDVVAEISGKPENLLMGERLALNLLSHMSGIATQTRKLVRLIENHKARLLDTRKTTPLWRKWEKRAVRDGGGLNHRMGLYDHVLIKDNHIAVVGSIEDAVKHARRNVSPVYKIEIEVDSYEIVFEGARMRRGLDYA
jgi:nicotinate-nucleotide pyrophosphorylase (carboxylating)